MTGVSRGRGGSALALALLLGLGACQPVGWEGPGTPSPQDLPPVVRQPAVPELDEGRPGPTRVLPRAPLEWDEVDPILHSVVARDERLLERVDHWIHFWTTRGSGHFSRYLERMQVYHGVVDRELTERGLPASLRYLPVVESGYHHSIVSRAGATGLWQIMTPTARGLGLSVTPLVDDRRDPLLATRAALDYLQELHGTFDSWFLALAAYNAGPGRVAGILSRHAPAGDLPGDEVYLRLRSHFPAETREFVPRFFAAAAIASNPEAFGFTVPPGIPALAFDEVLVPDATSLDIVALAAGVEEGDIRNLNPHFLRGFTPPGEARTVRVPPGHRELFEVNFALIPPEERISFLEHVVARGETLGRIAGQYGVPLGELNSANGNVDPRRLQIGQRLVIPVAGRRPAAADRMVTAERLAARESQVTTDLSEWDDGDVLHLDGESGSAPPPPTREPARAEVEDTNGAESAAPAARHHRVRSGDTLWELARTYGVSVDDLRRWNGLPARAVLRPGQELAVGAGAATHRVVRGDTWGGLAGRYGTTAAALARANGRSTQSLIRVGEVLVIP